MKAGLGMAATRVGLAIRAQRAEIGSRTTSIRAPLAKDIKPATRNVTHAGTSKEEWSVHSTLNSMTSRLSREPPGLIDATGLGLIKLGP
jgi:hypothetical protein